MCVHVCSRGWFKEVWSDERHQKRFQLKREDATLCQHCSRCLRWAICSYCTCSYSCLLWFSFLFFRFSSHSNMVCKVSLSYQIWPYHGIVYHSNNANNNSSIAAGTRAANSHLRILTNSDVEQWLLKEVEKKSEPIGCSCSVAFTRTQFSIVASNTMFFCQNGQKVSGVGNFVAGNLMTVWKRPENLQQELKLSKSFWPISSRHKDFPRDC